MITDSLEELRQQVIECTKCAIAANITNKVFGEGPDNASILSLSEAPGKDEDELGRPYVGRAGKFWNGMLETVGFQRDQIHVCNTLCCRPIDNKYAEDLHEADNCIPYLQARISIVKPKYILVFGKLAGYALGLITKKTFKKSYGKMLGQHTYTYTADGIEYTVPLTWTYHPSYLMRQGESLVRGTNANWESYIHMQEGFEIYNGLDTRDTGQG